MLIALRGRLFIVATGAFMLGILLGTLYPAWISIPDILLSFFTSALLCASVGMNLVRVSRMRARMLFLLIGILGIMAPLGSMRAALAPHVLPSAFQPLLNQPISLMGTIVADPDIHIKNQQLEVSVPREVKRSLAASPSQSTMLLVFAPLFQHFIYGEQILIAGTLTAPTPFLTSSGQLFHYDNYLAQKYIFATVPQASILEVAPPRGPWFAAGDLLFDIKHEFVAGLSRALPDTLAQLATGILTGDQHQLGEDVLSWLEISGLLWVVVLSGYHITLIAQGIEKLTDFFGNIVPLLRTRRVHYFCIVLGIMAIVFATGASAPSLRGGLMAILMLYARATHRTYNALRALCFVIMCLLLWNPFLLAYNFGFELSIIVTPAILLCVPILESRMLWIKNGFVREVVAVSIVAQLACMPLTVWQTGQLEPWAIPANILVMWLVPFAMISSFVAGITGVLIPPLSSLHSKKCSVTSVCCTSCSLIFKLSVFFFLCDWILRVARVHLCKNATSRKAKAYSGSHHFTQETLLDNFPIYVFQKRVDIIFLIRRHVVHHIGVFPHVDCQDDWQAGELADLLVSDPGSMEFSRGWIVVDDRPSDAARTAHFFYVRDETLPTAVAVNGCIHKRTLSLRTKRAAFELLEIIFMHAHAVEFKIEASS
jgi:ComEC/Rec2-related protein